MPTIAYFLGIAVRMFFNDHDPPHFHVRYQGFQARIRIADGSVIDGRLPPTVARLLRVRLKTSSRIAELSQHEADGGELQEGEAAAVEIFPVLGETAAAIEPSNRAFYDPTLG